MERVSPHHHGKPLKLTGFNNLTKALSFNLYDFCVARNDAERDAYMEYVHEHYNAGKVTGILKGICDIIEANILAVSDQSYDPWGASSMLLLSDIKGSGTEDEAGHAHGAEGMAKAMHLDKSHICAHTYPDFWAKGDVCSLRVDIDIATCGEISPLNALNYMFDAFESDVVVIDYVVRGYTRDHKDRRIFLDHDIKSIRDFIKPEILSEYQSLDLALQTENIWQTKLMRTKYDKEEYFLYPEDTTEAEMDQYLDLVKKEMRGLLHMWPE